MATVFGLTPEGFLGKPMDVIVDELQTDYLAILGGSAGTEPDGTIPLDTLAGQEITLIADVVAAQWDLQQAIVASFDPNQASDVALDAVCSLTGTTREAETFSLDTATCTGVPLTVLLANRVVKTADTGALFVTQTQVAIAALTAWASSHAYIAGARVTNGGNAYVCTTGGTSAGSGGPTTTASAITDNTVTWRYLGQGTGAVDVVTEAQSAGPVGALSGTLTVINTPVDGWQGVINLLDAAVGSLQETDPALRARREAELAGQGGSTADAIRAAILKVNEGSADPNHQPPVSCTVFYNDTDATDVNGVPPHAVEVLVQGGTDQDITQAVWNSVGAGTATTGNQMGTATDSQGNPQAVNWSRPVPVLMYVTATVEYDPSQWPANASAAVAQAALSALLTYGQAFPIGVDVRMLALGTSIITGPSATDASGNAVVPAPSTSAAAPGILDVSPLLFGITASPSTSTNVVVSLRQIATFDSTRCVITAVATTP